MPCLARRIGLAVAMLALLAAPVRANLITFSAVMSGDQEVPPNASPATGFITVILDDVANTLSVDESFSGLIAPATAAHIHAAALPGVQASVRLFFTGADGFPIGATAGTFTHTYDLSSSLSGISVSDFIAALEGGQAYADVHDSGIPAGEIRGQLAAVPEPSSLVLAGIGAGALALIAAAQRRRGEAPAA